MAETSIAPEKDQSSNTIRKRGNKTEDLCWGDELKRPIFITVFYIISHYPFNVFAGFGIHFDGVPHLNKHRDLELVTGLKNGFFSG